MAGRMKFIRTRPDRAIEFHWILPRREPIRNLNWAKPMKKLVIKAFVVISLLLCVATAVTWRWSYSKPARKASAKAYVHGRQYKLSFEPGEVFLDIQEGYPTRRGGFHSPPGKVFSTYATGNEHRTWAGIFGHFHSLPQYAYQLRLFFPIWWLLAAFAGSSIGVFGWTWRKRLRRPAHACSQCGYDLTGNVSGACPECGQKLPQLNRIIDLLACFWNGCRTYATRRSTEASAHHLQSHPAAPAREAGQLPGVSGQCSDGSLALS